MLRNIKGSGPDTVNSILHLFNNPIGLFDDLNCKLENLGK